MLTRARSTRAIPLMVLLGVALALLGASSYADAAPFQVCARLSGRAPVAGCASARSVLQFAAKTKQREAGLNFLARDPMTPTGPTYYARALRALVASPRDVGEKLLERRDGRHEARVRPGRPHSTPEPGWERGLHDLLGSPWPCEDAAAFATAWASAVATMGAYGLRVGRANYGDDDDADPALARALWCTVRALRPSAVVETGVAHGLSSRVMLESLARVGDGRLYSIDLPAMTIDERRAEIGVAVTSELRGRWRYLEGSSRRRLPPLLASLGKIDLFVHDSLHSTRNVRWELESAWRSLRPGGFVVVDDVDFNWGFRDFLAAHGESQALYCMSDDGERVFAIARKPVRASVE